MSHLFGLFNGMTSFDYLSSAAWPCLPSEHTLVKFDDGLWFDRSGQLPMLSAALKAVWFCLSFTGIIAAWIVLVLFSRAIGSYWYPIMYCIFATLMQGIFCLGMIWRMDPYQMPRGFCVAQTFLIYYAAWSLTGLCAAFTFATTSSVLWPSSMRFSATSTLAWNNKYYLPIIGFPLACLSVSVPVLLKVDAIQPTNDLHCDASHPEWGRFLGYSGFSLILTLPCFFLSAAAARRVWKMHLHNQRSSFSPRHPSRSHFSQVGDREVTPHTLTSPITFNPRPIDPETPFSSQSSEVVLSTPDADTRSDDNGDESRDLPATFGDYTHSQKMPPQWTVTATIDEDVDFSDRRRTTAVTTPARVVPSMPNLIPAIWRMILFQMVFFLIECLAAMSTIVDIATSRSIPTPFGSQHVALVLVGWGPAVVFGHLPAVRSQLLFWKR